MSRKWFQKAIGTSLMAGWLTLWGACTTAQVDPLPPIPPPPPGYVRVAHPEGLDLADLNAIFLDPSAPPRDSLKDCDADFLKLKKLTSSREELAQGYRELVKQDAVKYHWCFYGKMLELEEFLRQDGFVDERQKKVLLSYQFLTPISRAFMLEFQDTRYLRWAVRRYRSLSEMVFYRNVELLPQTTADLAGAANPLGNIRPSKDKESGVLVKYGIVSQDAAQAAAAETVMSGKQSADLPAKETATAEVPTAPVAPQEEQAQAEELPPAEDYSNAKTPVIEIPDAGQAPAREPAGN